MIASGLGKVDVQHLCKLAGVSRASYYRRFEARAPREADVARRMG
jgi:AcrR family transcriptional regulator